MNKLLRIYCNVRQSLPQDTSEHHLMGFKFGGLRRLFGGGWWNRIISRSLV
jgi:hypothetical protein